MGGCDGTGSRLQLQAFTFNAVSQKSFNFPSLIRKCFLFKGTCSSHLRNIALAPVGLGAVGKRLRAKVRPGVWLEVEFYTHFL